MNLSPYPRLAWRRLAAASAIAASHLAQAALVSTVNDHGLDLPHTLIDFEGPVLAENQPVADEWAAQGIHFTAAYANGDMNPALAHMSGNRVGNFQAGIAVPDVTAFRMVFDHPAQALAFALVGLDDDVDQFTLYYQGQLVGSAIYAVADFNPDNFYVFSGALIDEVRISVLSGTDRAFLLDNVQVINTHPDNFVPEPALPALLLAAGVPAWWMRQRRAPADRAGRS